MIEREYIDVFSTRIIIEAKSNKVVRIGTAGEKLQNNPSSLTAYFKQKIHEYIRCGEIDSKNLLTYCDQSILSPFQKEVFAHLLSLDKSKTITYKELSIRSKNSPNYARSIGHALNKNPFLFVIPCHRVVSSSSIGGFVLGIELKKRLLSIENCNNSQLILK